MSEVLTLNELARDSHDTAKARGFYDDFNRLRKILQAKTDGFVLGEMRVSQLLALIHTEVSEALEAVRKGHLENDNFQEELADILIRVFDLAGWLEIDLDEVVKKKMAFNKRQTHTHGKAF